MLGPYVGMSCPCSKGQAIIAFETGLAKNHVHAHISCFLLPSRVEIPIKRVAGAC